MGEKRYSLDQIVAMLEESEAGASTAELSRHALIEQSLSRCNEKFGWRGAVRARRLQLEDEDRWLKSVVGRADAGRRGLEEGLRRKP